MDTFTGFMWPCAWVCRCALVFLYVCVWCNLNSVHSLIPWWHQTFMSSPQLLSWPSATPHHLSLAKWLRGPQLSPSSAAPCGSHRYTPLYLVCLSEQLLFELREGQRCKDMNREHNAVCQNRNESENTCIPGDDVSLSAGVCNRQGSIRSSVRGDRCRWTPHPGGGGMLEHDWVQDEEL